MSAADKRNRMYELQAKEEERKRIQEEKARLEAERKAKEDPVKALGDPTLNFGDEPVAPQHREVLVGWTLAPPGNEGAVAFEGIPTEAGHYRVRCVGCESCGCGWRSGLTWSLPCLCGSGRRRSQVLRARLTVPAGRAKRRVRAPRGHRAQRSGCVRGFPARG